MRTIFDEGTVPPIAVGSHLWIGGLWFALLVYWAIAALFVKRSVDRAASRRGLGMRVAIAAAILLLVVATRRWPGLQSLQRAELRSAPMALTGAAIATIGAIVAVWARAAIGRNWGTPASPKTDTQLVTNGPYRLVRHPIYGGILVMMIGTAIGLVPAWWFAVLLAGAYFIDSARREEAHMTQRFPDAYPAYRARTRMLLPFLL